MARGKKRRFSAVGVNAPPFGGSGAPFFGQGASPLSVGRRALHEPSVAEPKQFRPRVGAAELKIDPPDADGHPRGHFQQLQAEGAHGGPREARAVP